MRDISYMGSLGIRTLQYIDDRMATESNIDDPLESCLNDIILPGEAVAYGLLEILTRLGYTLSLKKCNLIPSTCIRWFLCFLADSVEQTYILPLDKKEKIYCIEDIS